MANQRFHLLIVAAILLGLLVLIVPPGLGCTSTPPPVAAFDAAPAAGVAPLEVRLTDNSTGKIDYWEWDFDSDGTVDSTEQCPTHIYETAGDHTLLLSVAGPGGSDSESIVITVSPAPPQAAFTALPTSGYAPLAVQFTDSSIGEIATWAWDFDNDGTTDSDDWSPSHVYETSGNYTVSLRVTGPGGADVEARTISALSAAPQAGFTADPLSGYAPLRVRFTDVSTGDIASWAWDFNNDGTTDSTDRSPSYVYQMSGEYTVVLKVTGPLGSDTETRTHYVVAREKSVVTIGVLANFSGFAAAVDVTGVDAFKEAIRFYEEGNPSSGVAFNFVQYDHQSDYARVVPGYQHLKSNGMDVLYVAGSAAERDILQSYLEADRMPCIGGPGRTATLAFPWAWSSVPTLTWQSEVAMEWIADNWDYAQSAPKIGHQGWVLSDTNQFQEGIDNVLADPAYAGKFEWMGLDTASLGTVSWASSYDRFKDCDFIFCSTSGNSLATFVSQMRALGYAGSFVSGCDQFSGYWDIVQAATPATDLYGCYYTWWGPIAGTASDADWYADMAATTKSNHTDWATRLNTPSPMSGWLNGYVVYDAISRAAQDAGLATIDGDAIKAALDATQIDFAETGNTYRFSAANNAGLWTMRVAGWNVGASRWELASEEWYAPLSLPE